MLDGQYLALYCITSSDDQPIKVVVDAGQNVYGAITVSDNVILTSGDDYWLILSTFYPDDAGEFVLITSDNVSLCGGVSTEAMNWGASKSLYR